ncbi:MAG TPA: alpha/beta fold hydrolase [Allocoleopsis sp.]
MGKQEIRLGFQRDWVWRGWQVRYTFLRGATPEARQALPLLFIHGFGSALTQWTENLSPLSQSHSVYAIDLIGFGASEKAAADYKVGFWVEQVYDFWRTFINQPVVLVGHSLGALVALTTAVNHPYLTESLILLTLPGSREELLPKGFEFAAKIESWFATPLLVRPLFYLIRRPSIIRRVLQTIYTDRARVTEELVQAFLTPGFDRGAAQVLARMTKSRTKADFSRTTKELLSIVQVPILLIWGANDRIIPLSWGRQLPAMHNKLKLVEIPDAGHCSYDEQAECVNREILEWLATLNQPEASPVIEIESAAD